MQHFNKQNEFLYQIHYDISLACNNRCTYCYQLDNLDNSKLFDEVVFYKTINSILEFRTKNPEYKIDVFLKGGEPLLLMNRVIEFTEAVSDSMTQVNIFTNFNFKPGGTKITALKEFFDRQHFYIMCSVHDVSNLDWVKQNIKLFKRDTKDRVDVSILSSDANVEFTTSFADWMLTEYGKGSYNISEIKSTTHYTNDSDTDERLKPYIEDSDQFDDIANIETTAFIYEILEQNREYTKFLEFEILESEEISDFNEVSKFIAEIKKFDCVVGVDDFGAGYSNFNLLTLLDIDFVKIDGSLIEKINTSKDLEIIVNTIANFSKEFKVKTVAEYVSNEDIFNKIKELNIDYCQGYYFDKPLCYDCIK